MKSSLTPCKETAAPNQESRKKGKGNRAGVRRAEAVSKFFPGGHSNAFHAFVHSGLFFLMRTAFAAAVFFLLAAAAAPAEQPAEPVKVGAFTFPVPDGRQKV